MPFAMKTFIKNKEQMSRLVLDTNSLIQCISRRSRYHELWLSLLDGRNTLCVSTEVLEEYTEILQRKTSARFAELALDVITNNPYTLFVTPYYHFQLITADPDDNKFVDCAVAGNAKYIVTEDSHYDVLQDIDFPKVDIIKLDDIIRQMIQ
jgi:putative PIN family toxin of toxin-antitoxin system